MMAEQARILVVDDEPAVQNALSRALALERYQVAQATDGREALERARRRRLRGDDPRHLDARTSTAWRSAGDCATEATGRPC